MRPRMSMHILVRRLARVRVCSTWRQSTWRACARSIRQSASARCERRSWSALTPRSRRCRGARPWTPRLCACAHPPAPRGCVCEARAVDVECGGARRYISFLQNVEARALHLPKAAFAVAKMLDTIDSQQVGMLPPPPRPRPPQWFECWHRTRTASRVSSRPWSAPGCGRMFRGPTWCQWRGRRRTCAQLRDRVLANRVVG